MLFKSIRKLDNQDYDEVIKLGEYAFQYKVSEKDKLDRKFQMDKQILLGSYIDEHLAAKLHVLPMELFLGNDVITFGGIAGVATWPEYRRQGHVDNLIRKAMVEMKANNMSISMLAPFSVSFYRKFGWELTQYIYKYRFKPQDIGKTNGEGYCRRVDFSQYKQTLQGIYQQMASKYCLMMKREFWWWERRVLSEDDTIIIYFDKDNNPTGYLLAKMKNRVLDIMEFVFITSDACKGMLDWIKNHDSMTEQIDMIIQPDDQLVYYFDNPKISMSTESYFMTRIVDVEMFLKQYPFFNVDEETVIQLNIRDDIADWNNGTWTLVIKDKQLVRVDKNDEKTASVRITTDIQSLSAWFFGSEPVERLNFHGRVLIEGEGANKIIKPFKPALLDFF